MRKQLIVVCGGILGTVLLHHWWEAHATLFEKDIQPVYWAMFFALVGVCGNVFYVLGHTRTHTQHIASKTARVLREALFAH